MMSKVQKSQGSKNAVSASEYEALMTKIFAYGSKDAVAIAIEIQQTFYKINKTAWYLMIPYLLWIIYAGYINLAIAVYYL